MNEDYDILNSKILYCMQFNCARLLNIYIKKGVRQKRQIKMS